MRMPLALTLVLAATACARVPPVETLPHLAPGNPAFGATIEAHTTSPVVEGNAVDLLLNGDEIFAAKVAAIRSARSTINYAEYFYAEGPPGRDIAEALAERCRAGVKVNVLLDGFGTLAMEEEHLDMIKGAGCRVVTFRPLGRLGRGRHNNRNHRRNLVVDGRVGLTGGSGVSFKWMGDGRTGDHWRDTDVRVEGPVVAWLQAAFAQNWREATGEILGGGDYFPRLSPSGTVRAQVVRSSPARASYEMHTMFLLAIASAQRAVLLTNPYFLPDDRMAKALLAAAQRGVRVVALVPGKIDHNVVRSASRRDFGRFLAGGIEIFEYQAALLHAKTMVIDGAWATIGSTNLDSRSFALNEELNLAVYDAGVARRLEAVFHEDLAHARKVEYAAWQQRGIKTKLLELFVIPIRDQL